MSLYADSYNHKKAIRTCSRSRYPNHRRRSGGRCRRRSDHCRHYRKTACVAGNLVASDGDVLEGALLYRVVVGIEGGDGEFRQHVLFGVRQGEDVEGGHAVNHSADFGLLRIDATVASRGTESRITASVVELELCHRGWDFLVGQH